MAMPTVRQTVTIHRDPWAYISHPSIAVLKNGDWLAAFNHSRRRDPRMHPPGDPLFRTLLSRSSDQSRSWSQPGFAPDFDWYGTECPGIAQISNGTVILSQFRFAWYPLALARKLRDAGDHIALHLHDRGWTEEFSDDEWAQCTYSWARGYHGFYVHLSRDGGHLFDESVKIDSGEFRDGYSRTGVVELSDGRLAYAVQEHHPPTNRYCYVVFSDDYGSTWSDPVVINDDEPQNRFSEPDIAEVSPGELVCVHRETQKSGHLYFSHSTGGGVNWSEPEKSSIFGHPGHLLVLDDGRLLCTYGRRDAPFGIRLGLSEDGGKNWPEKNEIIVRDDLPNRDLGYPTTIEYAPGQLFVIYYGQDDEGVTYVMGTYVDL